MKKNLNTRELSRFREKRKWQIAFRRYVIERSPSPAYAPYFGLDIVSIREWFERQFGESLGWEDFGKKWQFDHIIPVTFFDFEKEEDLRLCWNFLNLKVDSLTEERSAHKDLFAARVYFRELLDNTGLEVCREYLDKIDRLASAYRAETSHQLAFLAAKHRHLSLIKDFSAYELELLNRGRGLDEILQEREQLRRLER